MSSTPFLNLFHCSYLLPRITLWRSMQETTWCLLSLLGMISLKALMQYIIHHSSIFSLLIFIAKYNPSAADAGNRDGVYLASRYNTVPSERSSTTGDRHAPPANSSTVPAYLWDTKDPDPNDALHYPKPPWAALRKARRSEVAQTCPF